MEWPCLVVGWSALVVEWPCLVVVTFSHGVAIISRGVVTFSHGVISSLVMEWPFSVFSDVTLSQF